jgi:hypothetical protein
LYPSPPATLSPNWVTRAGGYTTSAVAGKAKGTAASNLATLGRLDIADVDVQALVSVANVAGSFAGLTARTSAGANPNFYLANVSFDGTQFKASIFRRVNGVFTQLATFNLGTAAGAGSGVLRFTVVGGQLKLFFGGIERASVFDFTLKTGSVGIRSSLNPTLDDFGIEIP